MKYGIAIVGLLTVFGLTYIASKDRRSIRYRPLTQMIILQAVLAFVLLNTTVGDTLIRGFASIFESILAYAAEGINFVFGGIVNEGQGTQFFLSILLPIVFIRINRDSAIHQDTALYHQVHWIRLKQSERHGQA